MSNKYTNALIYQQSWKCLVSTVTRWQDTYLFAKTASLFWANSTSYFPMNKAANA